MSDKKEAICTKCNKPAIYTFDGLCRKCSDKLFKLVKDMTVDDLKDLILWCLDNYEKIKAEKAQTKWERLQKLKG